jgi:hypothetical protein
VVDSLQSIFARVILFHHHRSLWAVQGTCDHYFIDEYKKSFYLHHSCNGRFEIRRQFSNPRLQSFSPLTHILVIICRELCKYLSALIFICFNILVLRYKDSQCYSNKLVKILCLLKLVIYKEWELIHLSLI